MGKLGPLKNLFILAVVITLVLPGTYALDPLMPGINDIDIDILSEIITSNGRAGGTYFEADAVLAGPFFSSDFYMAPTKAYPRSILRNPIVTESGEVCEIARNSVMDEYNYADTIILTRDDLSPDSLAAAAYAKKNRIPILLVKSNEVPWCISKAIQDLGTKNFMILGGVEAVSEDVEKSLSAIGTVKRMGGATRYETAVMLSETFDMPNTIVITNGENPSTDAALVASIYRVPLVYVTSTGIPDATKDFLQKNKETGTGLPMKVALVDIEPAMAEEIALLMANNKWGADIEILVKNDMELDYWVDLYVNKQTKIKWIRAGTITDFGSFHVGVGEVTLKTRWFDYEPDYGAFRDKTYSSVNLLPGEKTKKTLTLN